MSGEDQEPAVLAHLLPFQRRIIQDMIEKDGLCIMAAGLGWQKVLAVMLHLQAERRRNPKERGVLLLLGCTDWQRSMIKQELRRLNPAIKRARAVNVTADTVAAVNGAAADQTPAAAVADQGVSAEAGAEDNQAAAGMVAAGVAADSTISDAIITPNTAESPDPAADTATAADADKADHADFELEMPVDVTNEITAAGRVELYRGKACLFVTTRILVVDMLNSRVLPNQIAGMIIMNAHRVTETSGEGFAARLYRSSNRKGYLRAFSDQPTSFSHGFAKVEKVMRALFIQSLYLWPRFEAHVKDCLKASEEGLDFEVVEMAIQMTTSMTAVYDAIADIMDSCIKEMRRSNKIDTTELTLEHGLFKSFDEHVRRQLETIWHTVSPRTKQVVADLKTLRLLAEYLLHFDAVTFLTYLETLRASEGISSFWLFHDAAHLIFDEAKKRVYEVMIGKTAAEAAGTKRKAPESAGSGFVIEPILEELPKWRLVCKIMQELQAEGKFSQSANGHVKEEPIDLSDDGNSPHPGMPAFHVQAQPAAPAKQLSAPVLVVASEARTIAQLKECLRPGGPEALLRRLYQEYVLQRASMKGPGKGALSRWGGRGRGRGRESSGRGSGRSKGRGVHGTGQPSAQEDEAILQEARQLMQPTVPDQQQTRPTKAAKGSKGRGRGRSKKGLNSGRESPDKPKPDSGEADKDQPADEGLGQYVRFYNLESREEGILWDTKPSYVIMYDPDMAFIRQLEVYKAEQPGRSLRVYHLFYEDSQESDKFTAAVSREVTVFQDLIRQKEFMVLPDPIQALDQAKKQGDSLMHPDALAALPGVGQNAITRRAGGRLSNKPQPKRIVIDVREFMGSLPAVLHQQGLEIVPVTLEVGDYILSPDVCIERKSLSDLRQSFISGRLYNQAEAMSKYYKIPVLLVEFDGDKEFVLHGPADITEDIKADSLISKLVLLTLHFPRLRIIWSRALHATADIFRSLKTNQDDPDPLLAATTGIPVGPDGMPDAGAEAVVNQSAVDVLRRLPGVSDANYRGLMHAAPNLAELASLSLAQLEAAMDGRQAAKKLHDWLHAPVPHLAG